MKKAGILCASDTELNPFLLHIKHPEITEKAMLKFYSGSLGQTDVVTAYSGICKVNAAITAQILIDTFHVDYIINAGTAGGMETVSVAHVCYVNHVPFLSVRSITDTAAHMGMENFEQNCENASMRSAEVVMGILEQLAAEKE